jgi:glycosyltransferase involved in cell wall biosynthesis
MAGVRHGGGRASDVARAHAPHERRLPTLSALVVAHNEERDIAACLDCLGFADEIVLVLDRCTDRTKEISQAYDVRLVEGAWEVEGPRRMAGVKACRGDWIIEIDSDERVTADLAAEIRAAIKDAPPGHFMIPFENFVGDRLTRHGWAGSWGVMAKAALFTRDSKHWGDQRIHPQVTLVGEQNFLRSPILHYVDRNISDMLQRLDRYTTARAHDLRASGEIGTFSNNLRRLFSRFLKSFIGLKGYREGLYGFLIALMAGLYPLISYLKARLERD